VIIQNKLLQSCIKNSKKIMRVPIHNLSNAMHKFQ